MSGEVAEKVLGKRLQEARQGAGMTQQDLCHKTGLSISTLAKIERGAIKAPSIFTVAAIAVAVQTPIEQLLGSEMGGKHPGKRQSRTGVRFVYFDVNGVLVRFFHRAFASLAQETGASPDLIESTFWHYNDEVCRGEINVAQFNALMSKHLHIPPIHWEKHYFASIEPIDDMAKVVRWAAQHYRVGLMTNIMPGFLDELLKTNKIPQLAYDAIIDSSKVGAVKPEPVIYQAATKAAGVEPTEILLIDDSRPNLIAAEKAGWKVMWFDDFRPDEGSERVRQTLSFTG